MKPISPVLTEEYKQYEKVYAKDQPQYKPLPVLKDERGILLSRWRLTDEERNAIYVGADIFLYNYTFNQPLQPVRIEVGECQQTTQEKAIFMGLYRPSENLKAIDALLSESEV